MKLYFPLAFSLITIGLTSCNNNDNVVLKSSSDTLSWAMGMSLAQTTQSGIYQFNEELVQKAFENTLKNGKQPINTEEYEAAVQYIGFLAETQQRNKAKEASSQANVSQEEYFAQLTSNNPNIKKAPEGFYYEQLTSGHGPNAKVGQRIRFDFKGTEMISGNLIEQTYGVGDPIIHVLGRPMFEGLIAGMQLMNAGSKYRFYFPHELVTGTNGIPPYTPVTYEVEIHEIYKD